MDPRVKPGGDSGVRLSGWKTIESLSARGPRTSFRIRRAQVGLQDLAVVVLRQRLDEHIILRPFEAGDRRKAERVELGRLRVADHVSHHYLAPLAVGPAD